MRRIAGFIVLAAGVTALLSIFGGAASAAHKTAGSGSPFSPRHGAVAGIVPSRGALGIAGTPGATDPPDECQSPSWCGSGNLIFHPGGSVMHTNKTYTIFWDPSSPPSGVSHFPAGYETKINQYLMDVAHDSGARSNVYATDPQYTDAGGAAQYNSTFGGTDVETGAFPASGCTDPSGVVGTTVCLTDSQLTAKINAVVAAKGWPRGLTNEYFIFTPKGVGSSFSDGFNNYYAYNDYCAYHSNFVNGSGTTIYANQPWTKGQLWTDGLNNYYACEAYPSDYPNGASTGADPTISVVSHEHNESVTDVLGNAWYDSSGYEDGDKCAWSYGTKSGSAGSRYNQVINGHHYLTQMEYNNSGTNCVLRMSALTPTISSFTPTSGKTRTLVTINGTHLEQATSVKMGTLPMPIASNTATQIKAYVWDYQTYVPTAQIHVTTAGGTATSASNFTVTFGISSFAPTSGPAGTHVTLNGKGFNSSTTATFHGVAAAITARTATTLTVSIPSGAPAGAGKFTATNTTGVTGTVYSWGSFTKS